MEMRSFFGSDTPGYAILSHRWFDDVQEISYQDYISGQGRERLGYRKVVEFCAFLRGQNVLPAQVTAWKANLQRGRDLLDLSPEALTRQLTDLHSEWAWIDTICIDKSSSAELSESINSMYEYYAQAEACIVYLNDVTVSPCGHAGWCLSQCERCQVSKQQLKSSQWFERGWTLQELVAPNFLIFVSSTWDPAGWISSPQRRHLPSSSAVLLDCVADVTFIPKKVLELGLDRAATSIAQRLSWAAHRITTRVEDRAYSLFGLLGVNMPLLYGEGVRAWLRLQKEVVEISSDESIFAWNLEEHAFERPSWRPEPVLAPSLERFWNSMAVRHKPPFERLPYRVTNQGLELRLRSGTAYVQSSRIGCFAIPLNCTTSPRGEVERLLILVQQLDCGHYSRLGYFPIENVSQAFQSYAQIPITEIHWRECGDETIYVHIAEGQCFEAVNPEPHLEPREDTQALQRSHSLDDSSVRVGFFDSGDRLRLGLRSRSNGTSILKQLNASCVTPEPQCTPVVHEESLPDIFFVED